MQIKATKNTQKKITQTDAHTSTLPHYHTKKCVEQHYYRDVQKNGTTGKLLTEQQANF